MFFRPVTLGHRKIIIIYTQWREIKIKLSMELFYMLLKKYHIKVKLSVMMLKAIFLIIRAAKPKVCIYGFEHVSNDSKTVLCLSCCLLCLLFSFETAKFELPKSLLLSTFEVRQCCLWGIYAFLDKFLCGEQMKTEKIYLKNIVLCIV